MIRFFLPFLIYDIDSEISQEYVIFCGYFINKKLQVFKLF